MGLSPRGTQMRQVAAAFLTIQAALIIAFQPLGAQAVARQDSVQLAGVAFLADARDAAALFPVATAIVSGAQAAGRPLAPVLGKVLSAAGVLVRTDLASRTGRALAFVFDDEYQLVDRVLDGYRVLTVLSAQLLTLDFRTQQAVSAMPVFVEYRSISTQPPSAADQSRMIEALIQRFGDEGPEGVFSRAAHVFRQVQVADDGGCLVRIGDITYDSSVVATIQERFGPDTARAARLLRTIIGEAWTTTTRQSLVPNENSQARGQMQGRFADGEIFTLRIPEPDYLLTFSDMRVRRGLAGQNAVVRVEGFGLQVNLTVEDTELRKPITSGRFSSVALDTLSVMSPPTNGWVNLSNSLQSLVTRIGSAAASSDRRWLQANDADKTSYPTLPQWLAKRCGA